MLLTGQIESVNAVDNLHLQKFVESFVFLSLAEFGCDDDGIRADDSRRPRFFVRLRVTP
jgi:hypothetical protein